MKLKKLYVISNDKVFKNNSSYFVYHNDLESILGCFINSFNVLTIKPSLVYTRNYKNTYGIILCVSFNLREL
jgi:cAMP phosphodiesterase